MSRLLIAGGTVVTSDEATLNDVLVRDGRIAAVAPELTDHLRTEPEPDDRIVDASGKLVMPGAIDSHVHLAHPIDSLGITTADDFFSGSVAGACGGVTAFIDFALQRKGESLRTAVDRRVAQIRPDAVTDYGIHVIVTDPRPDVLEEIPSLIQEGFPSYKLFMTYGEKRVSDEDMIRILEVVGPAGGLVFVHCENDAVVTHLRSRFAETERTSPHYHAASRPPAAEEEAVNRVTTLARVFGVPVFIGHVTTAGAVRTIRECRRQGQPVFGETCPHYLTLTDEVYALDRGFEAAKFVCSPPIRSRTHQSAVWEALEDGTLGMVTSDHAPFRFHDQKALGAADFRDVPNGLPGIETRLPLLYTAGVVTGRITPSRFVELVSTGPARLFGLYPRKGSLDVGADADVIVFDPEREGVIQSAGLHSAIDYSPYEGFAVKGLPVLTLSRGEVVWDGEHPRGERGRGLLADRKSPSLGPMP